MKTETTKTPRTRSEILSEINSLPVSVRGTISSYRNRRKDGTVAVYHNLQWTSHGKNHSFAIPVDKVEEFRKAVEHGRRLRALVEELTEAGAREIIASPSPLKKRSAKSSRAARKG